MIRQLCLSLLAVCAGICQTVQVRTVDTGSGAITGRWISHRSVGGHPAISYTETRTPGFFEASPRRRIMFARNSAADGSGAWVRHEVDSIVNYNQDNASLLFEVSGTPALVFRKNYQLWWSHNAATDGSGSWSAQAMQFSQPLNGVISHMAGAMVAGNPALVMSNGMQIVLARCQQPDGSGPWLVTPIAPHTGVLEDCLTLTVVQGRPVVVFRTAVNEINTGEGFSYEFSQLVYARADDATGSGTWQTRTVVQTAYTDHPRNFQHSAAEIAGRPCVAYHYAGDLHFARPDSADGLGTWSSQAIETSGTVGQFPSLAVADGFPVIASHFLTNTDLRFSRCDSADGTGNWTATDIDTTGSTGTYASLQIQSGVPTVAYFNATDGDLRWAKNSSANGSGPWTSTVVDDAATSGMVGSRPRLAMVDGFPAISYFDSLAGTNGATRYARANDVTGLVGEWSKSLVTPLPSGVIGRLTMLGGRPVFPYTSDATGDSSLIANPAADGSGVWTTTLLDAIGTETSLQPSGCRVIGGRAMLLYRTSGGSDSNLVRLAVNSAADGSGAWSLLSTGLYSNGEHLQLEEVNGCPAMVRMLDDSLYFSRNSQSDGSGAWTTSLVRSNYPWNHTLTTQGGFPVVIHAYRNPLTYQTHSYAAVNSLADGSGSWSMTDLGPVEGGFAYVGGNPAIVSVDLFSSALRLRRSQNSSFEGPWSEYVIDSTTHASDPSIVTVDANRAAIAYYDESQASLKFAWLDFSPSATSALRFEMADGTILPAQGHHIDFGINKVGLPALQHTLVVRNTGSETIHFGAWTASPSEGDFSLTNPPGSLAPGATANVVINFSPTGAGLRTASIGVSTSDPLVPQLGLQVQGTGELPSALELWWLTHFGSLPQTFGPSSPIGDPDGDGFPNSFEFAMGTNPNDANLISTQIQVQPALYQVKLQYTRNKQAFLAGVSFQVGWTEDLSAPGGVWNYDDTTQTVISESGDIQTVEATLPMGTGPRRFFRVEAW